MKRILTFIIQSHWLVFFAFHALGSLAGTLTFAGMVDSANSVQAFEANGPMRAFPLLAGGMGTASLLVAVMFFWAMLSTLFGKDNELVDGEIDKMAFGGGALVFTMLTAIALVQADPSMLMAATAYFSALILSWAATRIEWSTIQQNQADAFNDPVAAIVRQMTDEAVHPHLLARISGRERN